MRYLTFGTILAGIGLGEADAFRLVFVDGVISESASRVEGLTDGAYVGSICKNS